MSAEEIREAAEDLISHIARGGVPIEFWRARAVEPEDRDAILSAAAGSRGRPFS